MVIWEFGDPTKPVRIPTLNTKTNETGYRTFKSQEELIEYCWSQFKLPGQYNLKNTIRWKDAGMQFSNTVTSPNFEGGYYTKAIKGTNSWRKYWDIEKEKVKYGIIIDDVFIPPYYYWYLNYCPIKNERLGKKTLGDVYDGDLWFYHYITLCILLGKHACVLKTRQRGYSFKIMSLLYWSYSWLEGSINTIGAYKDESTMKSWRYLDFYRSHINPNTRWRRGPVIPKTQEWLERTYLVDGTYKGLDSKLSATTLNRDPENGVGGGQTMFFYEEAGIAPTLLQTIGYIRPAIERGNLTTGLIIISGAIGDLDDCKDLKEVFYHPAAHNFLSVKNIWDKKPEFKDKPCGLFVSEAYNLEGFMDEDGNSLVEKATEFVQKKNEETKVLKAKNLAQLDISQKPLSPEEAFAQRKHSEFPIELLSAQQERIRIKNQENAWEFKPIKCTLFENDKGEILMNKMDLPEEHKYPIKPEWEDKRGITTIYELPPENAKWWTYFGGMDTVEADYTSTSESIVTLDIYKRTVREKYEDENGNVKYRYAGGKIVATYRGRYDPAEKTHEQCWLLIKMYNALTYHDRSKPGFLNYMKRNGRAEKYLAKESDVPMFKDMNYNMTLSKSAYGFIISPHNKVWEVFKSNIKEYFSQEFSTIEKEDGEVIKRFTGIDRIDDEWLLEEYIQYNEEDNFDRIISSCAAITLGKTYENELGIPTVNTVVEKKKEPVYKPPRRIDMMSGKIKPMRMPQAKPGEELTWEQVRKMMKKYKPKSML